MGQRANSSRNASLDNKKSRAAGRQNEKGRHAPNDTGSAEFSRGKTGGAFGKGGHPARAVAAQENTLARTPRRRPSRRK